MVYLWFWNPDCRYWHFVGHDAERDRRQHPIRLRRRVDKGTALPNGITATTQTAADASTKVATTFMSIGGSLRTER